MTTQQDNRKMAKECGAVIDPNIITFWPGEFHVFCDRIRQQERDTIVKPVDLTIEGCVELGNEIGAIILRGFATGNALEINFHQEQLIAYSQALTAKLREKHEHDLMREKAEAGQIGFMGGQASARETIAGLQAIIEQKDAALREIMSGDKCECKFCALARKALALTSPTAALEAVRAEQMGKMAMLVGAMAILAGNVEEEARESFASTEDSFMADFKISDPEGFDAWEKAVNALHATSAEAKAFMDRRDAEVAENLLQQIEDSGMTQPQVRNYLRQRIAELRNSSAPHPETERKEG